jgi:uncharacterized protein YecE (DUF72 family)
MRCMSPHVRIGISGWRYDEWRGIFYPDGLLQKRELAFASRMLATIELNGTFHSLQTPESFRAWHDETPEHFVFAVKAPRYITHVLRLKECRAPLANFLASGLLALGPKLGPILWQFPAFMPFKADRFEAFFEMLPHDTQAAASLAREHDAKVEGRAVVETDATRPLRHAIEARHPSFASPEFVALLRRHGIAPVIADSAGKWPLVEDVTADFVYLRMHGDETKDEGAYPDEALARWAARIERWSRGEQPADARLAAPDSVAPAHAHRDVYVYFDNDTKAHAPFDAARLCERIGLPSGLVREEDGRPRFVAPEGYVKRRVDPLV